MGPLQVALKRIPDVLSSPENAKRVLREVRALRLLAPAPAHLNAAFGSWDEGRGCLLSTGAAGGQESLYQITSPFFRKFASSLASLPLSTPPALSSL